MKIGDFDVRRIGLGTNRLTHTKENVSFIKQAVTAGLQMIDTAHLYTGGESEETIGEALRPQPPGVLVASKVGFRGARPDALRTEIDESLSRLRTDTISLLYLHRVDAETPIEESLAVIKDCQDRGVVKHAGISQVDVRQIERARKVVEVAAVQNHYNLGERKYEDVVDYCEREGIAFVPFYPLRAGRTPAVEEIARKHQATPEQVMLAWLLQRSPVMLPIPGTLSFEHLKQNLGALDVQLTEREFESLA